MSIVTKIKDAITGDSEKKKNEKALDKQLQETFPSSDPLGVTNPNYGITGPEVAPRKDAPPIRIVRPRD